MPPEGSPELAAAPSPAGKAPFELDELFRSSTEVVDANVPLKASHARLLRAGKALMVSLRQTIRMQMAAEEEMKAAILEGEGLQ